MTSSKIHSVFPRRILHNSSRRHSQTNWRWSVHLSYISRNKKHDAPFHPQQRHARRSMPSVKNHSSRHILPKWKLRRNNHRLTMNIPIAVPAISMCRIRRNISLTIVYRLSFLRSKRKCPTSVPHSCATEKISPMERRTISRRLHARSLRSHYRLLPRFICASAGHHTVSHRLPRSTFKNKSGNCGTLRFLKKCVFSQVAFAHNALHHAHLCRAQNKHSCRSVEHDCKKFHLPTSAALYRHSSHSTMRKSSTRSPL